MDWIVKLPDVKRRAFDSIHSQSAWILKLRYEAQIEWIHSENVAMQPFDKVLQNRLRKNRAKPKTYPFHCTFLICLCSNEISSENYFLYHNLSRVFVGNEMNLNDMYCVYQTPTTNTNIIVSGVDAKYQWNFVGFESERAPLNIKCKEIIQRVD